MALNREPLRPVSARDIDTYRTDGAVCVRNVLSKDWIDLLDPVARRISVDKEDVGLLPSYPGRYMSRVVPEFRRLAFESPLAQAAGQVMEWSPPRMMGTIRRLATSATRDLMLA